jgi:hypothetical protein
MSLRALASSHLKAAQEQLADGTDRALRYACLDLRMAIECLTYDLLALYREDVLDQTLAEWRANKILEELKRIDPTADSSPSLQIANATGKFDASDALAFDEHRFETKWAVKAYHTLGRHLHERTFQEIEGGKVDDWVKLRARATEIAAELQAIGSSTGWNLRIKQAVRIPCDCGRKAQFNMGPLQLRSRARCSDCGAEYEVWKKADGSGTICAELLS